MSGRVILVPFVELPGRVQAQVVRDLYAQGWARNRILEQGGTGLGNRSVWRVCDDYDSGEHKYHPDVDEVALERCWAGDRKVWEGLTHYERQEFVLQVGARYAAEAHANRVELAFYNKHVPHGGGEGKSIHRYEWLDGLANAFDLDRIALRECARKRYKKWAA